MTKKELVAKLADGTGLSKVNAEKGFSMLVGEVKAAVSRGDRVAIPGLGVFRMVMKKARTGRNPLTGKTIEVPEKKGVKFSVSSTFKSELNGKKKAAPKKAPAPKKKAPVKKKGK